jgi:hypothetical protein
MTAMRKRRGRPASDYFIAFLGLALLGFVVAIVATSGSCHTGVSPELGTKPGHPAASPTPAQ